jgi:hypothetical protein
VRLYRSRSCCRGVFTTFAEEILSHGGAAPAAKVRGKLDSEAEPAKNEIEVGRCAMLGRLSGERPDNGRGEG